MGGILQVIEKIEIEGGDLRRTFDSLEDLWDCQDLAFSDQMNYIFRFSLREKCELKFLVGGKEERSVNSPGALEQCYTVNWGNYVGRTRIGVQINDGKLHERRFEVKTNKLPTEEDFQRMVEDVCREVANLAFSFRSKAGFGFIKKRAGRRTLYEDFVFLEDVVRDVEGVCRGIERNPHRRLVRERIWTDFSQASAVDSNSILNIVSNPEYLISSEKSTPLALKLGGRLPRRVLSSSVRLDYDTYENRFLKFVLRAFLRRAERIENGFSVSGDEDFVRRVKHLRRRLNALMKMGFLEEVGDLDSMADTSQVLLKEDNYNYILRKYLEFLLVAAVDWEELDDAIDNKDVARLYEYWTYFKVLEALRGRKDTDPGDLFRLEDGRLTVDLRRGPMNVGNCTLYYNRAFSRPDGGSYSVTLRPDITLEKDGMRILFDAKYRFEEEELRTEKGDGELDEEEFEEETRKRFVTGDLYKMHTYRDAIEGVKSVFILFPGTEKKVFQKDEGGFGVGAIPLSPSQGDKGDLNELNGVIQEFRRT